MYETQYISSRKVLSHCFYWNLDQYHNVLFSKNTVIMLQAPSTLARSLRAGDQDPTEGDSEGEEEEEDEDEDPILHEADRGGRPVPQPRSPRKRHASPDG